MTSEVQTDLLQAGLFLPVEQRASSRKAIDVSARLLGHDAIPRPVRLINISRGGIALQAPEAMQANDACALAFDIEVDDEARRINVWAKVAYCIADTDGAFRIGIRFRDYDSHSRMHIEHLCDTTRPRARW